MLAVGIVGSYRAGGVTEQAVKAVLEGAAANGAETQCILLRDKDVRYCRNCRECAQAEGDEPGRCVTRDDMAGIIATLRQADVLVVGSPMNIGQTTALTKTFEERLAPLFYWPWGARRPPVPRKFRARPAAAVIVTGSAMPAPLARLLGPATLSGLREIAGLLGARVVEEVCFGPGASAPEAGLDRRSLARARAAGARAQRALAWLEGPVARQVLPVAARVSGAVRETFDLGGLVLRSLGRAS